MGMRLVSDVLIDRISTWFIETLTMSRVGGPVVQLALVLLDLVEDHHRVIQRVAEDGEDRDHRRRGHVDPEQRVDAHGHYQVVERVRRWR